MANLQHNFKLIFFSFSYLQAPFFYSPFGKNSDKKKTLILYTICDGQL
jgi:hypothetical protein